MSNKTPDDVMQARIDEICERVADGETIREIAAKMGVSGGCIIKWVSSNECYSKQYARARDAAGDLFESTIIDAAMAVTSETASADRVKIDALKWIAARRSPRKYGDRVDHVSTDGSMSPKSFGDMYGKPQPKSD